MDAATHEGENRWLLHGSRQSRSARTQAAGTAERSGLTGNALKKLTRASERRADFSAGIVWPELDRFVAVFARFADFEFANHDGPAAPIFAAVREAQLLEMRSAAGDVAKSATLGGVSGGLAAAGVYGAVATWGTASTGTAIATLHGVALSNATMAALGGGALSAGGGGMAAGAAALGGIAAAPLLLVGGAVYWHLGKNALATANTNAAEMNAAAAKYDADRARIERLLGLVERLAVSAELLTGALSVRVGSIERWPLLGSVDEHTPAEQAYAARTALIAETLLIVATTSAWTPASDPAPEGERAAAAAESLLQDEEVH